MPKNSNRLGRVEKELKRQISEIIDYSLQNSKVKGIISVTKTRVTPDLKYARVYISTLDFKSKNQVLEGLNESKGYIRSQIAKTMNLRVTPDLIFVYDDSEENGMKIDNILRELKEEEKLKNSKNNTNNVENSTEKNENKKQ